MRYRKLDANGDMVFGGNSKDFLKGRDATIQAIKTRLRLLKGEWWENTDAGFPLFQDVLGKRDELKVKNRIVERIQQTEGVLSVSNVNAEFLNRKLSFTCSISTVYGDATFSYSEE